jgi:hypothetical protein
MTNSVFSKNGRPAFFALGSVSSESGQTHAVRSELNGVTPLPHELLRRTRVNKQGSVGLRQTSIPPAEKSRFDTLPNELKVDIIRRLEPFAAVSAYNSSWMIRDLQKRDADLKIKFMAAHVMRAMATRLGEPRKGFHISRDAAMLADLRACSAVIDRSDVDRIIKSALTRDAKGRYSKACILGPLMSGRPISEIESLLMRLDALSRRPTRSSLLVTTCATLHSRDAKAYEPFIARLTSPLYAIGQHNAAVLGNGIQDMPPVARDDVCTAVLSLKRASTPEEPRSEFTHSMWNHLGLFSPSCQALILARVKGIWNATVHRGRRQFLTAYFDVDAGRHQPVVSTQVSADVAGQWRQMLSTWPSQEPAAWQPA